MRIVKCDGRETVVEDRGQHYCFPPNQSFEEIARAISKINRDADALAQFRQNLPDLMETLVKAKTLLAEAEREAPPLPAASVMRSYPLLTKARLLSRL